VKKDGRSVGKLGILDLNEDALGRGKRGPDELEEKRTG